MDSMFKLHKKTIPRNSETWKVIEIAKIFKRG